MPIKYASSESIANSISRLREEVKQGNPHTRYELGCYLCLDGNLKEGIEWLKKAIESSHAGAMYELGRLYLIRDGKKRNYKEAYIWLSLAISCGNENDSWYQDSLQLLPDAEGNLTSDILKEAQTEAKKRRDAIPFREYKWDDDVIQRCFG